jgi:hypothetical protein
MTARRDDEASIGTVSRSWHSDRRIQIGHIISTIGLTVTMVVSIVQVTTYIGKLDGRVAVIEQQMAAQRERDERQDRDVLNAMQSIAARLDRLENKIDRIAEGQRK